MGGKAIHRCCTLGRWRGVARGEALCTAGVLRDGRGTEGVKGSPEEHRGGGNKHCALRGLTYYRGAVGREDSAGIEPLCTYEIQY